MRGRGTTLGRVATAGAALAVTLAVLGTGTTASAAKPPTPQQIKTMQAKADALAKQLSADQMQIQVDAERYDETMILLGKDRVRLRKTEAALASLKKQVVTAVNRLRTAAVEAYVTDDGASAEFAILDGNINTAGTISVYAGSVSDILKSAEAALVDAKNRVSAEAAREAAQERQAARAVKAAATAKGQAMATTSQVTTILNEVKGQLATMIAERQRALAAAAAARALRIEKAKEAAAAAARAQEMAAAKAAAKAAAQEKGSNSSGSNGGGNGTGTGGSGGNTGAYQPLHPAGYNSAGNAALAKAQNFLGVPYVWGGASSKGVDCSGLTMLAWEAAGVQLEHGATAQYAESEHIAPSQIEPGDLIFYRFANDGPWPITHVAMYVGSGPYGTNTVIQAEETGTNVGYFDMYWGGFVGVARP